MSARLLLGTLRRFAGIGANNTGHLEKWVSGGGGLTGILGVMLVSQTCLGLAGSAGLVASMGASAVLLFAVPHGPLSQPWSVIGGHLVSAVIGVACTRLGAHPFIASALAVALAISAMYYLRCIHPPGGATALTAVAGGHSVHALGFHYILTPVLLNVLVILLVAIVFNWPFPWRRYPAIWARQRNRPAGPASGEPSTGSAPQDEPAPVPGVVDPSPAVCEDNRETLRHQASDNGESGTLLPADIHIGGYYCNGEFDALWQIRQVIAMTDAGTTESGRDGTISYRIVAGHERRRVGSAGRRDFAGWARYEVYLNESSWQRTDTSHRPGLTGDVARMSNHRREV